MHTITKIFFASNANLLIDQPSFASKELGVTIAEKLDIENYFLTTLESARHLHKVKRTTTRARAD